MSLQFAGAPIVVGATVFAGAPSIQEVLNVGGLPAIADVLVFDATRREVSVL